MTKLNVNGIRKLAKSIIRENPDGVRYSRLVKKIHEEHPETPQNTIHGSVWDLATRFPKEVIKPSRGLFKPAGSADEDQVVDTRPVAIGTMEKFSEADFYQPFTEWLKNDLDEVTAATPLGGAGLKGKWGTPDIVGVYKPLASHLVKFPLEVVSAEVKVDPNATVTAFGQAIAYRLFSCKSYLVLPSNVSQEELSRIESLSMLFGLGLVVFDLNPEEPNFTIRMRAQRFSPDMFYVNEFADRLRQHDSEKFQLIFG